MVHSMKNFEYDYRYLQAGLEVLEDYLLSDEMFWPTNINSPEGMPAYPRITLEGLLLAEKRLVAYPKVYPQDVQVQQIMSQVGRIRSKWRVAWEKKTSHSMTVRLRMWGDFIEEYRYNPQENADRYSYEVRLRVMLALLHAEGGEQKPAEQDLLAGLDDYIKSVLELDGFIWEREVQSGFPKEEYWYLYGSLTGKSKPW
jgi:hypothetical protein